MLKPVDKTRDERGVTNRSSDSQGWLATLLIMIAVFTSVTIVWWMR